MIKVRNGACQVAKPRFREYTTPKKTIEVIGQVDAEHRLSAQVPVDIPGPVKLALLLQTDEDAAGKEWQAGIAREWRDELADPREDIYTLQDGDPIDEGR
jgi:hypothetical protein